MLFVERQRQRDPAKKEGETKMRYPQNAKAVIDVTKAPYFCDNTGKTDCTEALRRAMDDVLRPNVEGIQNALDKLNANSDPNYAISFEIRKNDGVINVIFPEDLAPAKILYFPNGTYLVSNTIAHSLEDLRNILSGNRVMEINRQIYIHGESAEGTVIRLKDNCAGFGFGEQKPIVSYTRMEKSNIAQTNSIADITIDCGSGNPGAIGLHFYSSNSGAIRNVRIRSSDPEMRGGCGLFLAGNMECLVKDLWVTGFDYGVKVSDVLRPVSCENIRLEKQKVTAFLACDSNVSIWKLYTRTKANPFRAEGSRSMITLLDSELLDGDSLQRGVVIAAGEAYLRNVTTQGYRWPLIKGTNCSHFDPYIEESSTSDRLYGTWRGEKYSLCLPVEETPKDEEIKNWDDCVCVDDFGAVGDGVTDSTAAIQRALDSGKRYVFFGTGHYLVSGTVTVPASVRLIDFMFCDFYASEELKNSRNAGFLKINEDSSEPLTLRQVFTWEKFFGYFRFIEHACCRDLVMKDLHTQCAGMYFNTVEGSRVFIENCACTMGGEDYCAVEPFAFRGQRVWAKNINPERGDIQILNDHSDLWILGMKTESWTVRGGTTAVRNINDARAECFGCYSGIGGAGVSLYENTDSDIAVFAMSCGAGPNTVWDVLVQDTQGAETYELRREDAFPISWYSHRLFGYVSQKP